MSSFKRELRQQLRAFRGGLPGILFLLFWIAVYFLVPTGPR